MATPKKAKHPRRASAARKEAVPDVPRSTIVSGSAAPLRVVPPAEPEVPERAARRRFTAEYKLQVLRQAEACGSPGEVGALLRREGLYSSHLTTWRRQREQGSLAALSPKKRGRPTVPPSPLARRVAELERENARLTQRLQQAETIIAVQKNGHGRRPPTQPHESGLSLRGIPIRHRRVALVLRAWGEFDRRLSEQNSRRPWGSP